MHNTEEKRGYKFTEEFGDIPEDWDIKGFKETFTKYATNSFTREDMSDTDGFIKNIHYGDILVEYGAILDCSCEKIPYINREITKSYKKVNNGDIVLADTAEDETVGKCIEVYNIQDDEVILAGMHTMHLRPNFKFASKFLGYFLNSNVYHNQLMQYVTGIKVSSISKSDINKTYILKPPFPEQEKIAEVLSDIDELIESTQKLIDKKKDLKTATMQKLLTPKEDWSCYKLGDCTDICTGKENNENKTETGLYPFFVRSDKIERINSYAYDGEAILIPGEGGIGKIFHYINGKFNYHQRVYKISNFKFINGKYSYYYMKVYFGKYALSNTVKATVDSLRLDTFEKFVIKSPSLDEQQQTAQTLSDMDSEIEALEKELSKYKDLKTGMMQELLTGKKRLV